MNDRLGHATDTAHHGHQTKLAARPSVLFRAGRSLAESYEMQPIDGIDKCPHCGGHNGFLTRIVFDATRIRDWAGMDIDTDDYKVVSETRPRCADCGKSVRTSMKQEA